MSENSNANAQTSVMTEVTGLLRTWEEKHAQPNYDPLPTLTRLAEIIEIETDNYLKMDPDPFDERHPSRTDPECKLGQILKALFRKDNLMNKLVNDYLRDSYYRRLGITGRDIDQLNIAACRLMLDIMPGLETSVVFQQDSMDSLINRLIKWVTNSIEPLQSYATGLLAAAMEIPDIATKFREQNSRLVPLLLQRLRRLKNSSEFCTNLARPFAHLASTKSPNDGGGRLAKRARENGVHHASGNTTPDKSQQQEDTRHKRKCIRSETNTSPIFLSPSSPQQRTVVTATETSNSSWAELESFMIGTVQLFPPTLATRQILILRYLTPMGEYQEFLSHIFENDALELILCYVNVRCTREARLAFEALKFLASLLCHKKFSIEFIQCRGLEALLEVPRPSIAATGVSTCLYYLGYCEEAMERVCLLPKFVITSLVKYALWLLECSHDSGRCQAIMFFGVTFQFKIILEEFDAQDGLRKLHNVIATLPILLLEGTRSQSTDDQECASRQIVRHVCVAYRRYLEAHLYAKVEQLRRSQMRPNERPAVALPPAQPSYKACKSSPEEIQQQIETLQQNMPFRSHWAPVDHLLKLGDITLFFKIIAFACEWNYSGRAETVRSALDVLAIACIMPKVQLMYCERVDFPEENNLTYINIILGAAEGDVVADVEVQKAALRVIGNCVCAPIHRVGGSIGRFSLNATNSPNKKMKYKSSEELLQKVWDSVRSNSGIMVLIQLMNVKTPITDADCIRTLACKALAGLARCETVCQIVTKLPLFTGGQLQSLMRDPILQEKRQEHVAFQKYAVELLERLSGKTKHSGSGSELDVSLSNFHRANVVAQTKIQFNDRQLLQLIHQHLVMKGYPDTASTLIKEANLSNSIVQVSSAHQPTKFRYTSTLTPTRNRVSLSTVQRAICTTPSSSSASSTDVCNGMATPPIKIIRKHLSHPPTPLNSRLQKQISNELPLVPLRTPQPSEEGTNDQPRVSLDSIITEYLTNQHALCKNPMATCPQFNLFIPHKCPDPKPRIITANNFTLRTARRQLGIQSKAMERRLVHSRFCPVQSMRSNSDDGFFTCAKFMPNDRSVIVGDYTGEIRLFNLHTGNEDQMFQALNSYVVNIEPSKNGELLLASCTWGRPMTTLWCLKDYVMKYPFNDEEYAEFSKATQDKIIGTKGEVATIYDVSTGKTITRFVPMISNQYTKNKATFNISDELVLSDGVLFDVNSGKEINKLDKLNQTQSGVFHPNGLEIVSNTEVWDIRTFRLLKTVPALNESNVIFSPLNHAIYAIAMEQELDGESQYDSSFKTVDAFDYSSIATIDVKKNIYDLAVNRYDTQIAIVENQGMYQSVQESVVRIYDVGRRRDDEDEQEEDDDEEGMDGSDEDGSDNDDTVLIDFRSDEHDNNENNEEDDDNDDDDDDFLGSDSDWTSLSSGSSNLSSISNVLL